MRLRTYQKEYIVVFLILIAPFFFTRDIRLTEVIAVLAVFFTFQHAQVTTALSESQAIKDVPEVSCYWRGNVYFLLKEGLWIAFFLMIKSWAALSGAIVFFIYPFWRRWFRKKYPLKAKDLAKDAFSSFPA